MGDKEIISFVSKYSTRVSLWVLGQDSSPPWRTPPSPEIVLGWLDCERAHDTNRSPAKPYSRNERLYVAPQIDDAGPGCGRQDTISWRAKRLRGLYGDYATPCTVEIYI